MSTQRHVRSGLILVAAGVAIGYLFSTDTELDPADFPGAWSSEFSPRATKALAKADARNCGEYRWKRRSNEDQLLVRCVNGDRVLATYHVIGSTAIGPIDEPDGLR